MQFEIESNIEKSVKEQHRVGRLHRLAQLTAFRGRLLRFTISHQRSSYVSRFSIGS
jgi:hypothetical protein